MGAFGQQKPIFNFEKKKIMELAQRLGTEVPAEISLVAWPIPVITALADRLEFLETRVKFLEDKLEEKGGSREDSSDEKHPA